MHIIAHFITITRHRHKVMQHCFRAGIPGLGLRHDLSKYSPAEFIPGARYYQGTRSPNTYERELKGYSAAWMHHKGRNRHHYEYWTDVDPKTRLYAPVKMPYPFLCEMVCDRIAACKIYRGKDYSDSSAIEYFRRTNDARRMHPETAAVLEKLLTLLAEQGEDALFSLLKRCSRQYRKTGVCELDQPS